MKQRIITAMLLIAVALPVILFGGMPLLLLGAVLTIVAVTEMISIRETINPAPLEVKILVALASLWVVFHSFDNGLRIVPNFGTISLEIIAGFLLLLLIEVVLRKGFKAADASFYLMTIIYVGTTFRSMLFLRQPNLPLFLFMIIVVAITDSMAYFVGRKFGRRKLAPIISPKKTIEGAIGGTAGGVIAGTVFGILTGVHSTIIILIGLSLIASLAGQMGDLVASSIKREYQIKDFGKIFPGHGGVLDRLDSHLFASLALYLVINLFQVVV